VSNVCMWNKNPIDLKPTLVAGLQNKKRMRVRVALQSNASRTAAPTIHNFRVDYVCGARE
jgi:hypothetical protein